MGNDDDNDMENTCGPEISGVRLPSLGLEDIITVLLQGGSGLKPALSGR
jgi:hypothetical protein